MHTGQIDAVSDLELAQCASEPIRIPGAIQPHGWLFAFDRQTLALQHVSANVATLLDRSVSGLLGQPLDAWLTSADAEAFRQALQVVDADDADTPLPLALQGSLFDAMAHQVGTLTVLELERCLAQAPSSEHVLARALRRLQGADGLPALHEVTVQEVRVLTGCDRVVIYAFGKDGHGRVLAEAKADDVASYLGLQFPASDIPAQARDLYKLNWLRMIADVDYEPVPILGFQGADSGAPLDLSFSVLRSVSPIHREYMRHMGSHSSISISLLKGGELWGLISCVHRSPRHIPRNVRAACLSIGHLLSLQISALEGLHDLQLRAQTQPLLASLREPMRLAPGAVLDGLAAAPDQLLCLTDATGAAIVIGERVTLIGACPAEQQVVALARWAAERAGPTGCYATAELPRVYEPAQDFCTAASGLLVLTLPKPVAHMVLWFRPEVLTTVAWAGEPVKAVVVGPDNAAPRLSPRSSFEAWKVLLTHHAADWLPHHVHAAGELRRCAIELDLTAQVLREQAAVASRDELVAVVSHDLRSPLTVVALQAELLRRALTSEPVAASRRMITAAQSIQRAAARMSEMLRDLLDLATIEQGRYAVKLAPHPVDELFEDANALLSPLAETKRIALGFECDAGLVVQVDPERIYQVISNLVGNALKFTAEEGRVNVTAQAEPGAEGQRVRFTVQDNGVGMSPEHLLHIFDRYWRVREANPNGTGLGLYIARGVVEAHGGSIWAESEIGIGSSLHFTLLCDTPALPPQA